METMTAAPIKNIDVLDVPVDEGKGHPVIRTLIYTISLGIILLLFLRGLDYYLTPVVERPYHLDYRDLRPAGQLGLLYGFIGAGLMIIMLVYSVRKRTRFMGQRPLMSAYLNMHIYLGVIGPLFIILHSSFKAE